jgi:hypothetical protein
VEENHSSSSDKEAQDMIGYLLPLETQQESTDVYSTDFRKQQTELPEVNFPK